MNFRKSPQVNLEALAREVDVPLEYAPREIRRIVEGPIPNSADSVVSSFIAMGENIAKSLEQMGDACEEQGKKRKEEYYKAAATSRKKAEYQAREAGLLIEDFIKLQSIARNGTAPELTTDRPTDLPQIEHKDQ